MTNIPADGQILAQSVSLDLPGLRIRITVMRMRIRIQLLLQCGSGFYFFTLMWIQLWISARILNLIIVI
jgi:hypothetical protein